MSDESWLRNLVDSGRVTGKPDKFETVIWVGPEVLQKKRQKRWGTQGDSNSCPVQPIVIP